MGNSPNNNLRFVNYLGGSNQWHTAHDGSWAGLKTLELDCGTLPTNHVPPLCRASIKCEYIHLLHIFRFRSNLQIQTTSSCRMCVSKNFIKQLTCKHDDSYNSENQCVKIQVRTWQVSDYRWMRSETERVNWYFGWFLMEPVCEDWKQIQHQGKLGPRRKLGNPWITCASRAEHHGSCSQLLLLCHSNNFKIYFKTNRPTVSVLHKTNQKH